MLGGIIANSRPVHQTIAAHNNVWRHAEAKPQTQAASHGVAATARHLRSFLGQSRDALHPDPRQYPFFDHRRRGDQAYANQTLYCLYTVSGKKSLRYFRHIFDKLKHIFIIFGMSRPE